MNCQPHESARTPFSPVNPSPFLPSPSVKAIRHRDAAFQAVRLVIEAYRRGEERGGSIDWEDLDQAHQVALEASGAAGHKARRSSQKACERLVVVIGGGLVQAVVADRPDVAHAVAVIDYDTEGFEPEDLRHITQSDGGRAKALIVEHCVEPAAIDLDEVFQTAE